MPPATVLHLIKGLGRGGAERLLLTCARHRAEQWPMQVAFFLPHKNHLVEELRQSGCPVNLFPASNFAGMLLRIPAIVRMVRRENIQLIHAHLPTAGIVGAIVSRITGVPLVYSEHNLFSRYHPAIRLLSRWTLGQRRMTIAVSKAVEEDLRKQFDSKLKLVTIPNGVDTVALDPERFSRLDLRAKLELPQDAIIVSTVAVFTRQKRLDRWLSICRLLRLQDSSIRFVMAGDGPLREALESEAEDLMRDGVLFMPGRVPNPEQWLAASDIFLMSSDYEGLPVTLLEAMSLAMPVVVTPVGGIPSVVATEVNGFLFPVEDEDKAVETLLRLVQDKKRRHTVGQAARETVASRFNAKRYVASLEEVYTGVLQPDSIK